MNWIHKTNLFVNSAIIGVRSAWERFWFWLMNFSHNTCELILKYRIWAKRPLFVFCAGGRAVQKLYKNCTKTGYKLVRYVFGYVLYVFNRVSSRFWMPTLGTRAQFNVQYRLSAITPPHWRLAQWVPAISAVACQAGGLQRGDQALALQPASGAISAWQRVASPPKPGN